MKRAIRNLRVLTLMIVIIVATGVSTSSAPAPQDFPDSACVSTCAGLLFEYLSAGGKNNDHDHACISVYRHCRRSVANRIGRQPSDYKLNLARARFAPIRRVPASRSAVAVLLPRDTRQCWRHRALSISPVTATARSASY